MNETNLLTPDDLIFQKKMLQKKLQRQQAKTNTKLRNTSLELTNWGKQFRHFLRWIEREYYGTSSMWCIYDRKTKTKSCKYCGMKLPLQKTFAVHRIEGCFR